MKKIIYLTLALCALCVMIFAGCSDGGSGSVTVDFETDGGSEVDSVSLDVGGRLPSDYFRTGSNVPTKDGYRFKGWAIIEEIEEPDEPEEGEEAGETPTPEVKEVTVISTAKTFWEDTTLTAQWVRRITIIFDLGSGVSGDAPESVAIDENTGLGSKYPTPSRAGTATIKWSFIGWFNGGAMYAVNTPIVTDEDTFTLTAQWEREEEYRPANAQSPAIHPGNHFVEIVSGGTITDAKTGVDFTANGLFSNIEKGQGVLSSKWYRTTTEAEANAATADNPKGEVIVTQNASAGSPHELSLPFAWHEDAAGEYWYYVVVTNTNEKATSKKQSSSITQNRLKVIVSD